MIKKINYDFLIKTASSLLVFYLLAMIILTVISQKRLVGSQQNELNLQIENNLITLSTFLKFEKENIMLLAQNKNVISYFQNKALGMSLKYGLKTNIVKIDNTIENFIKDKTLNNKNIFDAIVILDEENQFISKKSIDIDADLLQKIRTNKSSITSKMINNKIEIFISRYIYIDSNNVGLVISKINFKDLLNKMLAHLKNRYPVYILHDNKIFDFETLLLLDKYEIRNIQKEYLEKNILESGISILINTNIKEEYLTSKNFIVLLIILSVIVFLGIYFTFELNRKNMRLSSRMEDTKRINSFLEEKVNKKTLELQTLNGHLKERVQEEINKNKSAQRILYNQSKMALMGQMLDNIAHQWRQPLSAISSCASSVKVQKMINSLDDKTLIKNLDRIIDSTVFLSDTIEDFRGFFKLDKTKKIFNVKDTYLKTKKLMISVTKNSEVDVIENLTNVLIEGYPNELVQVFLNIINNAYEAFDKKNFGIKKLIFIDILDDDKSIIIKIRDNAGGIPIDTIHKIFDSYFTTKKDTTGTGIGLFMTKEIVEKHMKGTIKVRNINFDFENHEYLGVEFIIKFPKDNL